jgi:apolipoprotein D and lipocalin family protein
MRTLKSLLALPVAFVLVACQTAPSNPITTVERVDLERFMGDWYVIANIPTFVERDAYNAVESYRLTDEGTVATTFTFRRGGFDGKHKVYRPTGFVRDRDSNAVWGMQFIWPFKADFRIVYLDEDYTQTIIGRNKRDYVWIMARSPSIPETDYQYLLRLLAEEGYDVDQIQRVPQRWPEPADQAARRGVTWERLGLTLLHGGKIQLIEQPLSLKIPG